jgi:hypothetical protein
MNRDIIFILIVFILVISGVYLAFFSNSNMSKDSAFALLKNLEKETEIEFSSVEPKVFIWSIENDGEQIGTTTVNGKSVTAIGITNSQSEKVKNYFEGNEFKIDSFNIDPSTLSGISGYKKGKQICVIKTTVWKDDQGMPMAIDKLDVDVSCGELNE